MDHRAVEDRLYAARAETARALASPSGVELLDLLAQGERTVDALARRRLHEVTVIDVRPAPGYEAAQIPGALSVPLEARESSRHAAA